MPRSTRPTILALIAMKDSHVTPWFAAALCALSVGTAEASSMCWPESRLLGVNADGWVWGHEPGSPGHVDDMRRHDPRGRQIGTVRLTDLECGRRPRNPDAEDCAYETAAVPLRRHPERKDLVAAPAKTGQTFWLNAADLGDFHPIIAIGRVGAVEPAQPETVWHSRPARRAPVVPTPRGVAKEPVFGTRLTRARVLGLVRNAEGVWMHLEEYRVRMRVSDGSWVRLNRLRTGHVLHRDAAGVLRAVVTEPVCD